MHPIEQLRFVARASGADANLLVREAASALTVFEQDRAALLTACRRLLTRQPAVGALWWMCSHLVTSSGGLAPMARRLIRELEADRTGPGLAHLLADHIGGDPLNAEAGLEASSGRVAIAGWPETLLTGVVKFGGASVAVLDVDGQGSAVVRRLERSDVEAEEVDGSRLGGIVRSSDLVLIEAAAIAETDAVVDVGNFALAAAARAADKPVWLVVPTGRRVPAQYWDTIVDRAIGRRQPLWLAPYESLPLSIVTGIVSLSESDSDLVCLSEPSSQNFVASCPVAEELLVELA